MSPKRRNITQSGNFILSRIDTNPSQLSQSLHTVYKSSINPRTSSISTGGGTRRFCTVHGDVPSCFLPIEKAVPRVGATEKNSQDPQKNRQDWNEAAPDLRGAEAAADQHARDSSRLALWATASTTRRALDLVIIHKNARSLSNDEAVDELFMELEHAQWDFVMINETWRAIPDELWTTQRGGHLFAGSGYNEFSRGVAIIVNSRWKAGLVGFSPINERLATLDIDIHSWRLRLISAYFPHCGYADMHVQALYDTISTILAESTKQHRHPLLAADFNAQVGPRADDEFSHTTGNFALPPTNSRGQWLKSWAGTHDLIITNTHFQTTRDNMTTFTTTSKQPRQYDYILVQKPLWRHTHNSHSSTCPDLGSDHNAVRLHLHLPYSQLKPYKRQRKRQRPNWPPNDYAQYHSQLDHHLTTITATDNSQNQQHITNAIIDAVNASSTTKRTTTSTTNDDRQLLADMLRHRRTLPNHSSERTTISKRIKTEISRLNASARHRRIEQILDDYRCLRRISHTKSVRDKTIITNMTTSTGQKVTDRQDIADVFANFYEALYAHRKPASTTSFHNTPTQQPTPPPNQSIPPFTQAELAKALRQLRNGRSADASGIKAEMLKEGNDTLHQHLLRLFNDIIRPDATTPEQWKHTTITIIHKSGDPTLPNNYRPIAVIPLMYKLFARLLYNRLAPLLDKQQTPDQAGFRPDYSTEDHLYTFTMLHEQAVEWQLNLWVAAIDFKKAFDSIDHDKLWDALAEQQVPTPYIRLIHTLYTHQTATVKTDRHSRTFNIQRGVKQGDPLSSLLFNALLEHIFKRLKLHWTADKFGMQLHHSATTRLTNLRFADDVLLVARTKAAITTMLTDVYDLARDYGLELHPDKTYILSNDCKHNHHNNRAPVSIRGHHVIVLPFAGNTKYLGRVLSFDNYHTTEVQNRITCAWRKFHSLRKELTNKHYSLKSRLRLLNGTITPTILYACTSWTLTKDLATTLLRTQRRMLRLTIGTPRRLQQHQQQDGNILPDTQHDNSTSIDDNLTQFIHQTQNDSLELWSEYIQRSTRIAEAAMTRHNITDWVTTYYRRKWRWAQRITNLPTNRWSHLVTNWKPDVSETRPVYRKQGRPHKRWHDDIDDFNSSLNQHDTDSHYSWRESTTEDYWRKHEKAFVKFCWR